MENVFDNKLISDRLQKIADATPENLEEMKRCEDPVYFYNKYVRKEDQPEITREEYDRFLEVIERRRYCGPFKYRMDYKDYPLSYRECFPYWFKTDK